MSNSVRVVGECPCGGWLLYGGVRGTYCSDGMKCTVTGPFETPADLPIDSHDNVAHPKHYTNQVREVEAWDVLKYFPYLRGNAMKYLWRAGDKDDIIQDLRKALAYINKEIEMIEEERAREQD